MCCKLLGAEVPNTSLGTMEKNIVLTTLFGSVFGLLRIETTTDFPPIHHFGHNNPKISHRSLNTMVLARPVTPKKRAAIWSRRPTNIKARAVCATSVFRGGNQTWLAMGNPCEWRIQWENHPTKWRIFQQAMFDYWRVPIQCHILARSFDKG